MPPFFGRTGLLLEGGLDGLAGQLPASRDGSGLDGSEHLSVGCVVGGGFELLGQQQGVFDEQRLEWGVRVERAAGHR
jgi:hypothetical protein